MKLRSRSRRLLRARRLIPAGTRCPNCGTRGLHWISTSGLWSFGFWTCPMLYGPGGRRLNP